MMMRASRLRMRVETKVFDTYAKCKAKRERRNEYCTYNGGFSVEPRVAAQDNHGAPVSSDYVHPKSESTIGVQTEKSGVLVTGSILKFLIAPSFHSQPYYDHKKHHSRSRYTNSTGGK